MPILRLLQSGDLTLLTVLLLLLFCVQQRHHEVKGTQTYNNLLKLTLLTVLLLLFRVQ